MNFGPDVQVDLTKVRVFYMETDGADGRGLTEAVSGEVRAALRGAVAQLHLKYGAVVKQVRYHCSHKTHTKC